MEAVFRWSTSMVVIPNFDKLKTNATLILLAAAFALGASAASSQFANPLNSQNLPPGTGWWNGNPNAYGGQSAAPKWPNRTIPSNWVYYGEHGGYYWYRTPTGYWC